MADYVIVLLTTGSPQIAWGFIANIEVQFYDFTNNLVTTDLELWVVLDDGSHTSHNGHFLTFIARSCCESAFPCIMFATCGKHIKSHYRTQTMVDILHALEMYLFYMLRQSQAYFVPAFMFLDSLPGRSHQPGSL